MNNFNNNNDEVVMQIRKFLKQVGVGSHQIIENELKTEKGKAAAQFLMGQRYIEALKKQAKKENTYLVKQDINFVPR